jgi:hypothetical protein
MEEVAQDIRIERRQALESLWRGLGLPTCQDLLLRRTPWSRRRLPVLSVSVLLLH